MFSHRGSHHPHRPLTQQHLVLILILIHCGSSFICRLVLKTISGKKLFPCERLRADVAQLVFEPFTHTLLVPTPPPPLPQACIYDTCACKHSEDCMCAALSSYVHACAIEKVLLTGWREVACSKTPRPPDQNPRVSPSIQMLNRLLFVCFFYFSFQKRNTPTTARPILSTVTT